MQRHASHQLPAEIREKSGEGRKKRKVRAEKNEQQKNGTAASRIGDVEFQYSLRRLFSHRDFIADFSASNFFASLASGDPPDYNATR